MASKTKGPKRPLNTPGRSGKQKLINGMRAATVARRHASRLRAHKGKGRPWMAGQPMPQSGGRK